MIYIIILIFLSLSIFMERIFTTKTLAFVSGMWMVIIGYSMILLPIINIIYFVFKKKGVRILGAIILVFFMFVFTYGSYLAWTPVVRTHEITLNKKANMDELTIFVVSDLHLGELIGKRHLEKLVRIVDERQPDIVMIPGDIINDNIGPFLKENMGEVLAELRAPLGVYAVSGNHDYYGGDIEQIFVEMDKAGITMLGDEMVQIDESLYIIGRNDKTDNDRKSIKELMKGIDRQQSIIMLDHQPIALSEANENGIDILLSGHTHRGQIAPANIITGLLYENDWGYLQKGNLHSIVTSGFGFWVPI
ncbi:metallophosphoesterase [Paracerasibacillus soli]|uniref:Metallophosphoesterase n=1 Tax=Paracerasibacillus soli TaxID=480284 RepID=A0ABU5CNM5_9BACI|nr:metallophosphoesterase [Virgibacillus soli]MDY0407957.1 metallophosphoesterase [Virgibacillus soli]